MNSTFSLYKGTHRATCKGQGASFDRIQPTCRFHSVEKALWAPGQANRLRCSSEKQIDRRVVFPMRLADLRYPHNWLSRILKVSGHNRHYICPLHREILRLEHWSAKSARYHLWESVYQELLCGDIIHRRKAHCSLCSSSGDYEIHSSSFRCVRKNMANWP